MTKKAQRSKTPAPVSDSVVEAMEAKLEQAHAHAAAPDAPVSSPPAPASEPAPDLAGSHNASHGDTPA